MNPSQANECSPLVLITDGVGESLSRSCPPTDFAGDLDNIGLFPGRASFLFHSLFTIIPEEGPSSQNFHGTFQVSESN